MASATPPEPAIVLADSPFICGEGAGGVAATPTIPSGSVWATSARWARVWVPSGSTLTITTQGDIEALRWFGSLHYAQQVFDVGVFEIDGLTSVAGWSSLHDQGPVPNPFTLSWGPEVHTWLNAGTARTMLVRTQSGAGLKSSTQWDVGLATTAGSGGDNPGCVDERTKRGSGLGSVGDVEDPVNSFTGSYTETRTDLTSTGELFGLDWSREYDSGGTAGSARWGFSFSDHVDELPSGDVELTLPSSRVVVFESDGLGGFDRPIEYDGRLEVDGSGWKLTFSDGSTTFFDSTGAMTSRESWDGQTVTATYSSGLLSALTSSEGPSLSMSYSSGKLTAVTTSDGRTVTYGYDLNGYLGSVTLPGSLTWTYTNDAAGRVTLVEDPTDVPVVELAYDGAGRVISQTISPGAETTFSYDLPRSKVELTDVATSTVTTYFYDGLGRLTSIEDADGEVVERSYDSYDELTSTTSRLGGSTTVVRNGRGLVTELDPAGSDPVEITYDAADRMETVTDASGTTTYTYDGTERIPATITDDDSHSTTVDVVDGLVATMTDPDGVTFEYRYNSLRQLEEIEDEYGNVTTYGYDGVGRHTSEELPSGALTEITYDSAGRPDTVTAADGGVTTTTYDDAGRILTVTDPTLAQTVYDYDPATGLLSSMTDPASRVTTYTYNAFGDLERTTYADTSYTEADHGPLGRVTATRDELGRETTYDYDDDGNVTAVTDPELGVTETTYDNAGRVTSITDPDERTTTRAYDPDTGLLTSETTPAGTVTWTYDDLGRPKTVTDLRGAATEAFYTPGGRIDHVTAPAGTTSYGYDDAGRLETITEPGSLVTTYSYDADSRIGSVTSPAGDITSFTHDGVGRTLTTTDPAGVITTNTWTLRGELESSTKTGEGTVEYSYNPDGTLDWVDDALDHRTSYSYDSRGRQATRTGADAEVWSTVYNPAGELESETDPLNRTTSYTYDDAGRVATIADPSGRTTTNTWTPAGLLDSWSAFDGTTTLAATFGYDTAGRRNTATVGSRTWTASYNAAGDVTSATNPDGRAALFAYDSAGRRTSMRNPDGTSYSYAYDTAGRIDTITPNALVADSFTAPTGSPADTSKWADVSSTGGTVTIDSNKAKLDVPNTSGATAGVRATVPSATNGDSTFTYQFASAATATKLRSYGRYVDANNNYRVELSADSTTGRFYKVVGGTTTSIGTFTVPSDTNAHKLRFQVDGTNLRVKIWDAADPEPNTWTSTVTDSSVTGTGTTRVQVARSTGVANSATIDDWSHIVPGTSLTPVASYDFDGDGHLTGEDLPGSSSRDWTWVDGQLTGYTQTVPGANRSTSLSYNSSGRIATEATGGVTTTYGYDAAGQLLSSTPSSGTASSWTYDNVGRRATQTIGAVTTTYTYDDAGQLGSAIPSTGTSTSFAYDGAGRRTSDTSGTNVTSYGYDPAGRLTNITLPSGDTQLRGLNPDGLPETVANTVSATTTTWTLDWDPATDIDRLATMSQGSATTDLIAAAEAPWGVAAKGADNTALAADVHGSTINSTGAGVPRANSYNAYGTATGSDTLSPKVGYRGELTLGSLTNLRARDYQPSTGAFTTTDPLSGMSGTPVSNNPYHYADNDPLNRIDPTGLRTEDHDLGCETAISSWVCEHRQELTEGLELILALSLTVAAGPAMIFVLGPIAGGAMAGMLGMGFANIVKQKALTGHIDEQELSFHLLFGAFTGAGGGAFSELLPASGIGGSRLRGLATEADEAVFWSGIRGGDSTAATWASKNGGATLETTLARRGIALPAWDPGSPASVAAWRNASAEFAAGASGNVRVLQADAVRVDSIWAQVEFPALKANPNVTSITSIDPRTGAEVLLWSR